MAKQQTAARIRRGAKRFQRIAYLAAALAILCVGSELLLALSPLWRGGDTASVPSDVLAQAILAAPVLFFVWGLSRARRLFRRIESGELFSADNSRDFALVGWAVFGGALWSLTIGGLAPPQTGELAQQLAAVGLGARDLALVALGLALVVVGQVMAEARRLKTDNDSFL